MDSSGYSSTRGPAVNVYKPVNHDGGRQRALAEVPSRAAAMSRSVALPGMVMSPPLLSGRPCAPVEPSKIGSPLATSLTRADVCPPRSTLKTRTHDHDPTAGHWRVTS